MTALPLAVLLLALARLVAADWARARTPAPPPRLAVKARHASPTACYSAREDAP